MLQRILEPEVMDTPEEARDYDSMDHSEVNRQFVTDLLTFMEKTPWSERLDSAESDVSVLDVGTGTAQIPIELCSQKKNCQVIAIDLSQEMLKLAQQNVEHAGFAEQIALDFVDAKHLPYPSDKFDVVISNSILHHIPVPEMCLAEMSRMLKPGGVLFVRDLKRPNTEQRLDQLVETYAGNENEHQQKMFRDSLHAALTLREVEGLLERVSLPTDWVNETSDRHWTIAGIQESVAGPKT